eukprot:403355886
MLTLTYEAIVLIILINFAFQFENNLENSRNSWTLSSQRQLMQTEDKICFSQVPQFQFPQILGGYNGNTEFQYIEYDSTLNEIIACGSSKSNDIVSQQPQAPIILKFDETTGRVIWHSQLLSNQNSKTSQINPLSFNICSFQKPTGQFIISLSTNPQYGIHIFDRTLGTLINSFYEYDNTASQIKAT